VTGGRVEKITTVDGRPSYADLTASQARILDRARTDGPRTYTGVASRPIKALERLGLVTVDWDASLDAAKGRLRWRITVTAKQ
jgi:hypothetical protein